MALQCVLSLYVDLALVKGVERAGCRVRFMALPTPLTLQRTTAHTEQGEAGRRQVAREEPNEV